MSLYDKASLIQIPSLYKDGLLVSTVPEDRSGDFTFSRGSNLSATRVKEDGYIEKGYENLLLQSNTFSDATWGKSGVTLTSGQSGYNGSSDAWLITSIGGNLNRGQNDTGVLTFSVYAKKGTNDGIRIRFDQTSDSNIYIDLNDGSDTRSAVNVISHITTSVGGGWYKISMTFVSSGLTLFRIYPTDDAGNPAAGSIYIQDAQINQGLAALPYVESGATKGKGGLLENTPRIDFTGGTPSLLLEPSRTNLITQSEYFGGSDWISSNVTITDNATTSPEGVQNATLINFTSGANYFQNGGGGMVSGNTYTISCYVKRALSTDQVFKIYGNGNIVSGDFTATSEWQRFTYTFTAASTNFSCGLTTPSICQIHLYGFQVEQATYKASYIPTYGVGQTRAADSVTPLQNLRDNGITTSGAYTLFFDLSADIEGRNDGNNSQIVNLFSGQDATSETISIRKYDNTTFGKLRVYSNTDSSFIDYVNSTNRKYAMVVNGTNVKFFTDGAEQWEYNGTNQQDNLGAIKFNYGHSDRTSTNWSQVLLFPTALTDSECIALTTIT